MSLFNFGSFVLHSGGQSDLKIDCDALTNADWKALAAYVVWHVINKPFASVEGVPQGGLRLAGALRDYRTTDGGLLIVDDVCTTGASLEKQRRGRKAEGVVVFNRGELPNWVTALFTFNSTNRLCR